MKTSSQNNHTKITSILAQAAMLIAAAALLAGCGSKMSGTYAGGKASRFEQMTFKSNGKVEVTVMMLGSVSEYAYEVEGKNVKLMGGGATQVFKMGDDGTLDGGGLIGKYYLVGKDPARIFGTYASVANEKFVFKPDGFVTVQTSDNMIYGHYTAAGNKLTLITDKSMFAPSQTLTFKIVNQETLEGDDGRQMKKKL
jgi:hypothetical protein